MPAINNAPPEPAVENLPPVPLTVEGASVLHQMLRIRWSDWKALSAIQRGEIAQEAATVLAEMERNAGGQSAAYSLLGHKGDLILIHFRQS
ncbi:MAG TPA: heme-dependent peroxidase, partial [Bryobacteraceae bacterium]